jgi:hypothetical protein
VVREREPYQNNCHLRGMPIAVFPEKHHQMHNIVEGKKDFDEIIQPIAK